ATRISRRAGSAQENASPLSDIGPSRTAGMCRSRRLSVMGRVNIPPNGLRSHHGANPTRPPGLRAIDQEARRVDDGVIVWLIDPDESDPSIRWQVMRDLADSPEAEWRAERARVETEGWGGRLLSHQDDDGRWAAGAHFPGDYA